MISIKQRIAILKMTGKSDPSTLQKSVGSGSPISTVKR